jgi:hypothetical protein
MIRRIIVALSALVLGACNYNTIQDVDLTPEATQAFAQRVKHIKVRVWSLRGARRATYEEDPIVVAAVTEALEDRGYTVELVHDDPFDYGTRDDPHPAYVGYIHQLVDGRFLGPDTAFIELAYGLEINEEYRVQTHTTDQEVGHIDDASGRRIATEYATGTTEEEYTVEHTKAHADAAVFFGGQRPVYDRYVSHAESRDLEDVTSRVLDGLPAAER